MSQSAANSILFRRPMDAAYEMVKVPIYELPVEVVVVRDEVLFLVRPHAISLLWKKADDLILHLQFGPYYIVPFSISARGKSWYANPQ
ncbi:MAG: hypothetical protein JKY56_08385 [Kofleriaceae bacterium]|nr:hypothetical protein [Kofleriaceae bacterium]